MRFGTAGAHFFLGRKRHAVQDAVHCSAPLIRAKNESHAKFIATP
jgi:hypothetical protein